MRWSVVVVLLATACVRHIYPYEEKVRDYRPARYAEPNAEQPPGSLWSASATGWFEDARARRVGDLLTVRIDERADAVRDASTKTSRTQDTQAGVSAFLAAMRNLAAANPGLDPSALVGASSASEFEGEGKTSRSGSLRATLPVHVREVMPNGDFFVEGRKVILVNEEESHLYVSGVVRPIDIMPDNSVFSSRLADVELEYTGRGVLAEKQSPGWLARVLDLVWPF